jgi:hypothetical protein
MLKIAVKGKLMQYEIRWYVAWSRHNSALVCLELCGCERAGPAPCGQAGAAVDRLAVAKETSHRAIIATT